MRRLRDTTGDWEPHIYSCALGSGEDCVIGGKPFRWCYRCLDWISEAEPETACEPHECCPSCGLLAA